jgi:hypothetical protein
MTIKYGLHLFFFEMTESDGQNFLAAIVLWRTINLGRPVIGLTSKCEAGIMFN